MLKDQKVITINCPWCDWKGTIPQYLMHFDKCGAKKLGAKEEEKPMIDIPETPTAYNERVHKALKKILDEEKAKIQEIHTEEPEITIEHVTETPIEVPSPEGTGLIRNERFVDVDGKVEEPSEKVIETTEETSGEEASKPSEEELVFENRAW